MKYLNLLIYLTSSLVTSAGLAETNTYLYHPETKLALGRGFEPNILAEPKLNCLEFTPKADIDSQGATSTSFFMTVVTSSQELKQVLGIDFSMDARQLNTSVNAGFNLNNESMFNRNSVSVVITAASEFGTVSMTDAKLIPRAQAMIDNVHHDQFKAECGSHLVVQQVVGVRVAIVLTLNNIKTSTANEIKANAGFKYNAGSMSLEMQMKINNLLKSNSESGGTQINIFATGSKGVEDLDEIVKSLNTDSDAFSGIRNQLGEYLKKFPVSKAVPIRFYTKEFGFGFENKYENLWKAHYERKIQRIASAYRRLTFEVDTARAIYNNTDMRSMIMSDEDKGELMQAARNAEVYLDGLVELHRDCQYNVYKESDMNKPNTSGGVQKEYCAFDESKVEYLNIPEVPEVPTLEEYTAISKGKRTDLEIFGSAIESVEVFYNDRMIEIFKFKSPNTVTPQFYEVNLDHYWSMRKSHVSGPLRGRIVIRDLYGRTLVRTFHYALHAEGGSLNPYYEKFLRTGIGSY